MKDSNRAGPHFCGSESLKKRLPSDKDYVIRPNYLPYFKTQLHIQKSTKADAVKRCKQLCDRDSGYGALQCKYTTSGCLGSNNNYCYPNLIWSGTESSTTGHYRGKLNSGSFSVSGNTSTNAEGVRCVPDLIYLKQKTNLQTLCDDTSGKGALRCDWNTSGCPGAKNGNCYPNIVWSGTESGSGYYDRYLNNGTFNQETDRSVTFAFGVRCVPGFEKL